MSTIDKILQHHIDNNLKRVSSRHGDKLNASQIAQLQDCLDLHYRLRRIKIEESRGKRSMQNALREINSSDIQPEARKYRLNYRLTALTTSMALLGLAVLGGGVYLFNTPNTLSGLSRSNIQSNSPMENLQNLNKADTSNDIKLVEATMTVPEVDFSQTTSIDEAVNEDF